MMKSFIHIALYGISLLLAGAAVAQQTETAEISQIKVLSKAWKDSICLRWAPNDPLAWQMATAYGYRISRTTVVREGKILNPEETVILTPQPIKALPLQAWEPIVQDDQYAAIAAQAIYGERFQVTGGEQTDMMSIINQSKELEMRFSFSLFAADMSPAVARAMGLWFTDTQVKAGERYLYRVYSDLPPSVYPLDTGTSYLGLEEAYDLPAPIDVEAEFGDQVVIIRWNKTFFRKVYSAWLLERSADGGNTYELLSEIPMVATENESNKNDRYLYRRDSLPQNGKVYHYRVRGISPFGEKGPPSEAVSGQGVKVLSALPRITQALVGDRQESVALSWSFPEDIAELAGFHVYLSDKASGSYARITEKMLKPGSRDYTSSKALSSSYFVVEAIGKDGGTGRSYPYFVQLADSIPPAAPKGLKAEADTTGIVRLHWEANTENDFLAYQVYRANNEADEMSLISARPVYSTSYVDTITVNTLSPEVWYAVVALDMRFNTSAFSTPFRLERPDILPPVVPVFSKWEVLDEGIRLDWHPSSSQDVVQHLLYRRSKQTPEWTLVYIVDQESKLNSYLDKNVEPATSYEYTLLAVDDSGLESAPASPLRVTSKNPPIAKGPAYLDARADYVAKAIVLRWEYASEKVERFQVYKEVEGAFRLVANTPADTPFFADNQVKEGARYQYRIQVLFKDGSLSGYSPVGKTKY